MRLWSYHFPLGNLLASPPFKGWLFLIALITFFSWGLFFMMLIMSFPILLWSFKMIRHLLVGLWRLWLFNYPLSFTLAFPTFNSIDWHDTERVPSLSVLTINVQYFNSIWWRNPKILAFQFGYRIWSLMGVRVNGSIIKYIISNQYMSDFFPTFHPVHVY